MNLHASDAQVIDDCPRMRRTQVLPEVEHPEYPAPIYVASA